MIRVYKPSTPPTILTTRGAKETKKHCNAYQRDRHAYRNGTKTFKFKRTIYGHKSVKETLKNAQHGKCAFCESRMAHLVTGDVEHFRPKKGFSRGKILIRPGYYWLAYDWDNLLLACPFCNQRHKRNAFPLTPGSRRARSHLASIANELPLFIHPGQEDPATEIEFRHHVPCARNGSVRGMRTIRGLGLDRDELMEERERWLRVIETLVKVSKGPLGPERESAKQLLVEATCDSAQFAAMVRCFLASS